MTIYLWIIVASWAAFLGFWLFSAAGAKKSVRSNAWLTGMAMRVAVVIVVFTFLHFFPNAFVRTAVFALAAPGALAGAVGAACSVAGVAFAIWARVHLGRNWGMPMTLREKPELVTTGPYAYVRHPIYTGVLLAILGSTIAASPVWILVFIMAGIYFAASALREEKDMLRQFPDTYPAYKARTKMLIPFIF